MRGSYILMGGRVVLPGRVVENAALVVHRGRITFVGTVDEWRSGRAKSSLEASIPSGQEMPEEDVEGATVLPRLVEMHIHGAGGVGFERVESPEQIHIVREFLEARGVGCFVPTILWDEAVARRLVAAIEAAGLPASTLPGIYIEGPFVNPAKRGGIGLENIREPDVDLAKRMVDVCGGRLKIVTIAPELPGAASLYPVFEDAKVAVSLGHSNGSLDSIALPRSRYSFTHLFNAMSGIDHRGSGGLANLAFLDSSSTVELNADGVHVNAACMNLAAAQIRKERLVLTSDAVVAAGLPFGAYSYFGKAVTSGPDGVRYSGDGVLMGSNKLGVEIVKSFMAATKASLEDAVFSMSSTPGSVFGLEQAPGVTDDIFIWNNELTECRRPRFRGANGVQSDAV